jgi:hypothetical protein
MKFFGFLTLYRLQCRSSWVSESESDGLSLAVVPDLREARAEAGPDELALFETDVGRVRQGPGGGRVG